ncbi:MAG: hypothetical protein Q8P67_22105 [archaeon]|nr:hypothetical protein [archaeon]
MWETIGYVVDTEAHVEQLAALYAGDPLIRFTETALERLLDEASLRRLLVDLRLRVPPNIHALLRGPPVNSKEQEGDWSGPGLPIEDAPGLLQEYEAALATWINAYTQAGIRLPRSMLASLLA